MGRGECRWRYQPADPGPVKPGSLKFWYTGALPFMYSCVWVYGLLEDPIIVWDSPVLFGLDLFWDWLGELEKTVGRELTWERRFAHGLWYF